MRHRVAPGRGASQVVLEAARDASVVVAESPGLADQRGEPVRLAVRRHSRRGMWLVELGPTC
ncbi:hypothetical protein AB0I94_14025 [Streptomyces sp. NPDC050147]|uniref:hypothetical protein n=1 Tax=Streptomyces sp. NPDC050147 TaxID=3155513 RepID=UPI003422849B